MFLSEVFEIISRNLVILFSWPTKITQILSHREICCVVQDSANINQIYNIKTTTSCYLHCSSVGTPRPYGSLACSSGWLGLFHRCGTCFVYYSYLLHAREMYINVWVCVWSLEKSMYVHAVPYKGRRRKFQIVALARGKVLRVYGRGRKMPYATRGHLWVRLLVDA